MKMMKMRVLLFFVSMSLGLSAHTQLNVDSRHLRAQSTREQVLLSLADEATAEASTSTLARDGVLSAVAAFADAEADAEMGADLGMDIALEVNQSRGAEAVSDDGDDGPATLAEYCAGPAPAPPGGKLAEGTRVEANWEGYGTMYPGKIKEKNEDGTVDIAYDDGFTEKNVKAKRVDPVEKKEGEEKKTMMLFAAGAAAPRDDPACALQEFLKKLQDQLKKLNEMTSEWLAAQRAKIAGDKKPPARASVAVRDIGAAPAAAPPPGLAGAPATETPSEDEADALEKLKEQLAEREEYIKQLEEQMEDNNKALAKLLPATPAPSSGPPTIDDLIAEYKAKIAQRDARIEELLELIRAQEDELARIGAKQLSLKDIDDAVTALEKDVEDAKRKRDELNEDGTLDPELHAVIDSIIKSLEKMRKKINNLMALEAKAKADREKAEREADEAAAAARRKAEAEGKDADEAAAEAAAKSEKESEERVKKADLETMQAAQEAQKEMQEAEKGATKLDTGLHPHGAKWWRYRYEHSHIEALIMIFISFLMLMWSILVRNLKHKVSIWALPPGVAAKTELEEIEEETHGGVYMLWLHLLAEQTMVCILVFLSVWLMAKTKIVDYFPLIIKSSDDMRVPHTGAEYRHLALDICTIFFFAIMFYFSLMFAVAHNTWRMTQTLEDFDAEKPTPRDRPVRRTSTVRIAAMGAVSSNIDEFAVVKRHFVRNMNQEITSSTDPVLEEISSFLHNDLTKFPLSKYLKLSIRASVAELFHFGWAMWLPVICLFVVLMCVHRFAHMGYVRIMGFFSLVTLVMIVSMGWYTKKVSSEIQKDVEPETGPAKKSFVNKYPLDRIALCTLQFAMFFVCYGVARMICQPWMWELHFWPVFSLSIVAVVSAVLFVWLVAPTIPSFCALQALPPYMDAFNMKTMHYISETVSRTSSSGASRGNDGMTE